MTRAERHVALRVGMAAALLCAAALALFWPGYVAFDSLAQYGQALSGDYDDWHPPAMARLWSLFGAGGPAPMLVVQMLLYWAGLGVLAAALAATGRRASACGVLAIALWPPLLGWQAVVLKDTQMLAALLAASGLVAWWRLRGRHVPAVAVAIVALLFGYAVLVRANACFAVVPLAVMMMPLRPRAKVGLSAIGIVAAIGLSGPINHRLLRAEPSGVERTQAFYDLSGIGVRTGDPRVGLSPPALATLRTNHCVRPFFWDPLGEPARCEGVIAALRARTAGQLYALLAGAVIRHPLAYGAHRLAHLNSTTRWLVPARWYGAPPPAVSEPNAYGFGEPGRGAGAWQGAAAWLVGTPLGWPILWIVLGVGGLFKARGEASAPSLARALFVSALTLEASFAAISIASDWRYHLWPMTAVALGWVLVGAWPRGGRIWLALVVVLAGGLASRGTLPQAPQSYRGMLG